MKQYVIDQLRESDYMKIKEYLEKYADETAVEGIYWVKLPENLYSTIQKEHKSCQPYYFAVNLTRRLVSFEWLIRSRNVMRCRCISYASESQRNFIINFADTMLDNLGIKV